MPSRTVALKSTQTKTTPFRSNEELVNKKKKKSVEKNFKIMRVYLNFKLKFSKFQENFVLKVSSSTPHQEADHHEAALAVDLDQDQVAAV